MADRRTEILDAALRVLADHGMRGLTHRAVDAAAGIAPGSTSYYFRSRSALVAGCVDAAAGDRPGGGVAGGGGRAAHGPRRRARRGGGGDGDDRAAPHARPLRAQPRGRARAAACARRSSAGGDTIRALAARTLAAAGAADPAAAAAELAALLDGLVFTALVRGPHDPAALAAWVRPPLERALRSWTAPERRVAVLMTASPGFRDGESPFPGRRGGRTPATAGEVRGPSTRAGRGGGGVAAAVAIQRAGSARPR